LVAVAVELPTWGSVASKALVVPAAAAAVQMATALLVNLVKRAPAVAAVVAKLAGLPAAWVVPVLLSFVTLQAKPERQRY
jgi:hypothetical protein